MPCRWRGLGAGANCGAPWVCSGQGAESGRCSSLGLSVLSITLTRRVADRSQRLTCLRPTPVLDFSAHAPPLPRSTSDCPPAAVCTTAGGAVGRRMPPWRQYIDGDATAAAAVRSEPINCGIGVRFLVCYLLSRSLAGAPGPLRIMTLRALVPQAGCCAGWFARCRADCVSVPGDYRRRADRFTILSATDGCG